MYNFPLKHVPYYTVDQALPKSSISKNLHHAAPLLVRALQFYPTLASILSHHPEMFKISSAKILNIRFGLRGRD